MAADKKSGGGRSFLKTMARGAITGSFSGGGKSRPTFGGVMRAAVTGHFGADDHPYDKTAGSGAGASSPQALEALRTRLDSIETRLAYTNQLLSQQLNSSNQSNDNDGGSISTASIIGMLTGAIGTAAAVIGISAGTLATGAIVAAGLAYAASHQEEIEKLYERYVSPAVKSFDDYNHQKKLEKYGSEDAVKKENDDLLNHPILHGVLRLPGPLDEPIPEKRSEVIPEMAKAMPVSFGDGDKADEMEVGRLIFEAKEIKFEAKEIRTIAANGLQSGVQYLAQGGNKDVNRVAVVGEAGPELVKTGSTSAIVNQPTVLPPGMSANVTPLEDPYQQHYSDIMEKTGASLDMINALKRGVSTVESGSPEGNYKLNQSKRETSNFGRYQYNINDVRDVSNKIFKEPAPSKKELLDSPDMQEKYYGGFLQYQHMQLSNPKLKSTYSQAYVDAPSERKMEALAMTNQGPGHVKNYLETGKDFNNPGEPPLSKWENHVRGEMKNANPVPAPTPLFGADGDDLFHPKRRFEDDFMNRQYNEHFKVQGKGFDDMVRMQPPGEVEDRRETDIGILDRFNNYEDTQKQQTDYIKKMEDTKGVENNPYVNDKDIDSLSKKLTPFEERFGEGDWAKSPQGSFPLNTYQEKTPEAIPSSTLDELRSYGS